MYYIYHIKGVKFGCSVEPKRRVKVQGYSEYTIHETHTDIYIASDREQDLNREYGYPVDKVPYYKTVKIATQEGREKSAKTKLLNGTLSKAGKIGGKATFERGTGIFGMSEEAKFEGRSEGGKAGGKIGGKVSGKANVESGHMQAIQLKGATLGGKAQTQVEYTCPYCLKVGKGNRFKSYHIDNQNCKKKTQQKLSLL